MMEWDLWPERQNGTIFQKEQKGNERQNEARQKCTGITAKFRVGWATKTQKRKNNQRRWK